MIDVTNPTRRDLVQLARFVGHEVATLDHYQETFEEFRAKILLGDEQHALRFGHFFLTAIYAWYTTSQLISLRAITDTGKTQLNLGTLLRMIDRADTNILAEVPNPGAVDGLIEELKTARAQVHRFVSQRIAHRDPKITEGLEHSEADALLKNIDRMVGAAWRWVFGAGQPRSFIERDPFWVEFLFEQQWLPPTEFSERLAASREVRYVTENERRDFTRDTVWGRRPSDEDLDDMGMTREEFERFRGG